jgi:predicted MFS family arabinose efflux permease
LAVLSWGAWVAQKVLGRFASFSPLQLPLVYTGTVFTTLAGIALLFSGDHFFFWSGILVVAASIGLADPIGSALCLRYTKPHVAGRTMGIIFTILALAKTLAPPLAAWLIHLMP